MDVNKSFNDWLNGVQLQYNTDISALNTQVLNLTSVNSGLTQQSKTLLATNSALTAQVLQLTIANTGLTAQIDDLNEQIDDLQAQLDNDGSTYKAPFGVNIHPFNTEYADSKKVFDLVRSMGMDSVRMDMHCNNQGVMSKADKFLKEVVPAAKGIRMFAMLTHQGLDVTSTDFTGQYNVGYAVGKGWGKLYGKYFEFVEMGNELDNLCILPNQAGTTLAQFDPNKIKAVGNYIKGMMTGLKEAVPNVKLIMDVCWTHFAFITEMINTYGIQIDLLASHWYWTMEKAKPNYIEGALTSLYPKIPFMFNETGYDMTTGAQTDCAPMITRMKKNGVFFYELLDEYLSRGAGTKEGSFGLFDKDMKPKALATMLMQK